MVLQDVHFVHGCVALGYSVSDSLLRRGLLQSRLDCKLGKKRTEAEKRENKSARGTLPSFPALPFSLSSVPTPVFFFHWCLLTGAAAEERELVA